MKNSKRQRKPHDEPTHTPSLRPLTPAQVRHLAALKSQTAVLAVGPAGTGKTYLPAAWAAHALRDNHIENIILTRPYVESGRSLGFLKGDVNEKFAPFLVPVRDIFVRILGPSFYDYCLKSERIRPIPLSFVQGCSWSDSVILADEFENSTPQEFKLLLTRLGENSKIFVSGDISQRFIRERSGLEDAFARLQGVPGVAMIRYSTDDVVRSDFVRRVLEAYEEVSY